MSGPIPGGQRALDDQTGPPVRTNLPREERAAHATERAREVTEEPTAGPGSATTARRLRSCRPAPGTRSTTPGQRSRRCRQSRSLHSAMQGRQGVLMSRHCPVAGTAPVDHASETLVNSRRLFAQSKKEPGVEVDPGEMGAHSLRRCHLRSRRGRRRMAGCSVEPSRPPSGRPPGLLRRRPAPRWSPLR